MNIKLYPSVVSEGALDLLSFWLPEYYNPIFKVMKENNIQFIVIQGKDEVKPVDGRPWLCVIGDDLPDEHGGSLGPKSFHPSTIRRLFKGAHAVIILSAGPESKYYGVAAVTAAMGRNTVLVETRPEHESEWQQTAVRDGDKAMMLITPNVPPGTNVFIGPDETVQ